jgi:hypothetical protein
MGLLGMFSAGCALWLSSELKRTEKELEEARKLLNLLLSEQKIETDRLATLHAWIEVDAEMTEILKPEELDNYLRDQLSHKIAEGIKPRLKIERKHATMFGIRYETELTVKEEKPCAPLTPTR